MLDATGIVTNSKNTGGIYFQDGTIKSIFVVNDFKGGGTTTTSFFSGYSPFFYCMPYLDCEAIFTPNSSFIGKVALYASSKKYAAEISLVGQNNSLINLKSGYLIKNAYPYHQIEKLFDEYLDVEGNLNSTKNYAFAPAFFRESLVFTPTLEEKLNSLDISKIENSGYYTEYQRCKVELGSLSLDVIGEVINMGFADFTIPSNYSIYMYETDFHSILV